jgi:hypothetical protein
MATIETVFIDASTGKAIGKVDMPEERLPQSFALATTFHIADEDWNVIKAEPMTAEEFLQAGKLVIILQKVVKIPTNNILFTVPTLCNEIATVRAGSTKQGKNVLELHEDDWRQIEFLSTSYLSVISAELTQVMHIYRDASVNTGRFVAFKHVHLRQQFNAPLQEEILLDQLEHFFPSVSYRYEGVSYQQSEGLIEGGFAFKIATTLCYGQQVEGVMKVLGLKVGEEVPEANKGLADALREFMATYHLCLVDWFAPQLITADTERLRTFLER